MKRGDNINPGFVYILINTSLSGLLKIGSTTLGAKKRAQQLSSSTGIPTPFTVAYEIYVQDYINFEKNIHDELSEFRVNPNREFFRYPLQKAIELIQQKASDNKSSDKFEAIEIISQLVNKYPNVLAPSISSTRICQDGERVYFEFTKDDYIADHLKNQIIERHDLRFIVDEDPDIPLFVNDIIKVYHFNTI